MSSAASASACTVTVTACAVAHVPASKVNAVGLAAMSGLAAGVSVIPTVTVPVGSVFSRTVYCPVGWLPPAGSAIASVSTLTASPTGSSSVTFTVRVAGAGLVAV